jgi:hypothetical protein
MPIEISLVVVPETLLRACTRVVAALSVFVASIGCSDGGEILYPFYRGHHLHAEPINIQFVLPEGATNAYVTTDNQNPLPSPSCSLTNVLAENGTLNIHRPLIVKLRYDLDGQTYHERGVYVVESTATDNYYSNRDAIDTFEDFVADHLLPSFGPIPQFDQTQTIYDNQGGSVTRTTDIEGIFSPEGRQTYSFNNYTYDDSSLDLTITLESGTIFGFMNSDGGFYDTDVSGSMLNFSGTYNGNADGNFSLDQYGRPGHGYYRVFCEDLWCAASEVFYATDSYLELIEIDPLPDEFTISCTP